VLDGRDVLRAASHWERVQVEGDNSDAIGELLYVFAGGIEAVEMVEVGEGAGGRGSGRELEKIEMGKRT
jgi:hypothetical protein